MPVQDRHSNVSVFNYPFDFAFFTHVTPGRCPTKKAPEIFIPPTER